MKKLKFFVLLAVPVLLLAACGSSQPETTLPETTQTEGTEAAVRSPWDYTWEEYEQMSLSDQFVFQASFASAAEFEQWCLRVMPDRIEIPWENGGKEPAEYTLDEFDALDSTLQILFENSFGSRADFEEWLHTAQYDKYEIPWADGGKTPAEYTLEEFEALTAEQQIIFQNSFESIEEFDRWLQQAQPAETFPDFETGDKSLFDYTWEEFEAMSAGEQMAFQNSFESIEEFDRWLQQAQGGSSDLPWDNSGKRPEDYTWAEFEALSPDLQIIFQSSFAQEDGFEKWLMENMPQ